MLPVDDQRNYLCATYHPVTVEPECFAVFLLRDSLAAAKEANSWLGGIAQLWITGKSYVAMREVLYDQGNASRLTELEELLQSLGDNLDLVVWNKSLLPEIEGPESTGELNTYDSYGEALAAWGLQGIANP